VNFRSLKSDFGSLLKRIIILGLTAAAGCTKPPEIPQLAQRGPLPIQQLALSARLNANDIRGIFRALNSDHRLKSLKSVFEDASTESLNEMGDLVAEYVLDELDFKGGLPEALRQRIKTKGFTRWLESSRKWSANPNFPKLADLLFYALALPETPSLLKTAAPLLDPDVAAAIGAGRRAMKNEYVEKSPVKFPSPESALLVDDLQNFLANDARVRQLSEVSAAFDLTENGSPLLMALRALKETFGAAGFEGFTRGLSRMIQTHPDDDTLFASNQLEMLVKFTHTASYGSPVLFTEFDAHPDLLDAVSGPFRDMVVKSYGGWIRNGLEETRFNREFWWSFARENPGDSPTENFKLVFARVLRRLEFVSGTAVSKLDDTDTMVLNQTLVLPAYAITRWLETTLKDKRNLIFTDASKTDPNFFRNLWNVNIGGLPVFDLKFAVPDGADVRFDYEKDLQSLNSDDLDGNYLDLEAFTAKMNEYVKWRKEFRLYAYKAVVDPQARTLRDALPSLVYWLDQTRRIAASQDPFKFSKKLVDPENGIRLFASNKTDLMDRINQWIGQIPRNWFPTIEEVLLRDSGISRFSSDDITKRTSVLSGDIRTVMDALFSTAPMLAQLDKPDVANQLPSAFELYYLVSKHMAAEPHALTLAFNFLSESLFLKTEKIKKTDAAVPKFPGIYTLVKEGRGLSQILYSLASIKPGRESSTVLNAMEQSNEVDKASKEENSHARGLDLALSITKKIVTDKKLESVGALDLIRNKDAEWIFDTEHVTARERAWGVRLINDGAHETLWKFFKQHSTRLQLLDFTNQLKTLNRSGELKRSFELLTFISDTRIKNLARLLLQWQASGELEASLDLAREWLLAPDPQLVTS
jgi:hypothetical protein